MRAVQWCFSAVGAVAVIGACTSGVLLVHADEPPAAASVRLDEAAARMDVTGSTGPAATPARAFRNGHYQVVGRYLTPGGDESIGVTVDILADVVTAVQVRSEAHSPTALQFQDQFRLHIAAPVVGRDLASLSVARVSGASLTSVGFNDALSRIRSEAM